MERFEFQKTFHFSISKKISRISVWSPFFGTCSATWINQSFSSNNKKKGFQDVYNDRKKNYSVGGYFESIKSVFFLLFMQNSDKFCLVAPVYPSKWTKSYVIRADWLQKWTKKYFYLPHDKNFFTKIFTKKFGNYDLILQIHCHFWSIFFKFDWKNWHFVCFPQKKNIDNLNNIENFSKILSKKRE